MIYATDFKNLPFKVKFKVYLEYLKLKEKDVNVGILKSRDKKHVEIMIDKQSKDIEKTLIDKGIKLSEIVERVNK